MNDCGANHITPLLITEAVSDFTEMWNVGKCNETLEVCKMIAYE